MAAKPQHLCFPAEFPYEFDNSDSDSDSDDFFAASHPKPNPGPWAAAGSPQSTLSAIGGWSADGSPNGPSQVASPPATPFSAGNDTWELIYAAAGQVARLKMAKFAQAPAGRGLLGNPGVQSLRSPPAMTNPSNNFVQFGAAKAPVGGHQRQMGRYYEIQRQNRVRSCCGGVSVAAAAWGSQSRPGSGVKRECAGTGVFLPRRYSTPPEPRMKKPTATWGPPPAVNVMSLVGEAEPRLGCGFGPDHEAFMARRNALVEQQRRRNAVNHEIRLPHEWTY